tara:strand:+ start:1002 stop:3743 length:2742 start_codon:yes stop_codon:yes gene_type:complete
MSEKKDQKLNLPKTEIPMKANLNEREPKMLEEWSKREVYEKIRKQNSGKEKFILHDGPPYANGKIHIGHAVNKVLKDVVIRSKSLEGYDAPYVPGWDCHGLPIELQVEKKLGKKRRELSQAEFRSMCREYAKEQIDIQKDDFIRLGVFGDWENRYASLDYSFEGEAINGFARIYHNGHVEKGSKPVHWCLECSSALAEAEVEYLDKTSSSIDVKFAFTKESEKELNKKLGNKVKNKVHVVIWTTTPWTIPGNQAVCFKPDISYEILEVDGEFLLVASELKDQCSERWSDRKVSSTKIKIKGTDLEGLVLKHPLFDRESPLYAADHVTTETGTGFVHTAPAHGVDDFNICSKEGLEVQNPVLSNGCYKEDIEYFSGMHVRKVDPEVISKLKEFNALVNHGEYFHSYPHCWRHKTPLTFMATPQWFFSMTKSGLLDGATRALKEIEFIPEWGKERMDIMLNDRPDWCISRQREWGIPIPLFYDKNTGEPHPDQDSIFNAVSESIKTNGIDSWDTIDLKIENSDNYEKSKDIFDVWFDSGITHFCVVDELYGSNTQSDLYLEGSDQHRGWFQSSLLTSIAMKGIAPYKSVLTHGFVVDEEGKKMSKSIGNVITPQEVIDQSGADILRFWIASTDFRGEMAFSKDILNRSIDGFRRTRNTMRFMISNLYDYTDDFDDENLLFLDKIILSKTKDLQDEIRANYENYNLHLITSKILNFCVNDLGGMYLDVIKDRLYTMKSDSLGRRSAQFTIKKVLTTLLKNVSPVLPFTAYEFYEEMFPGNGDKIFLEEYEDLKTYASDNEIKIFNLLETLRSSVYQEIESKRQKDILKNALDAEVSITLTKEKFELLEHLSPEIHKFFISSNCELSLGKEEKIKVSKSEFDKCSRCWHRVELMKGSEHCSRCESNMNGEGETRSFF